METLANLESFVRSAETGSFSAAARRLGLTPAAVSRNVAMLEKNIGARLFNRSTRKLSLTEAGERFLHEIGGNLDAIQSAIAGMTNYRGQPAGLLKVSMSPTFGISDLLPLLPEFLARYPLIRPEWHFENRKVDLVAEGYDAAIGGGFELSPGLVSRALGPAHVIAVAAPVYLRSRTVPADPSELVQFNGIAMRSLQTGRIRQWTMRDAEGNEKPAPLQETIVVNDPGAMREAALLGLGVALLAKADVWKELERGELLRVAPKWYADAGTISIYYARKTLLPKKTRVFIDFVARAFEQNRVAERIAGSIG